MMNASTWTLASEKIMENGLRCALCTRVARLGWATVAAGIGGLAAGWMMASLIRWFPLIEAGRYAAALAGMSAWLLIGLAARSASLRDGLSQIGAGAIFFIVAVRSMDAGVAVTSQLFYFQAGWVAWSMVFGHWDRATRRGMVALGAYLATAGVMM